MPKLSVSLFALLFPLFLLLAGCGPEDREPIGDRAAEAVGERVLVYPETPTVDVADEYHGIEVTDPYRWLEEDVRESDRVAEWVAAQNRTTRAHLDTLFERDYFASRLAELWNYERYGVPELRNGRLFYTRNDGLQDQSVLYMQEGLDGEPRMPIDPNTWSEDGTVSLAQWVVSPDGRHVA